MIKNMETIIISLLLIFGIGYNIFNMEHKTPAKGIYYDNLKHTDNVKINKVEGIELDYNANLTKVGDYFEINFDIINDSSVDVKISDLLVNESDKFINYKLTYNNGKKLKTGDILKKGEKKNLTYKVSYLNKINEDNYTFDTGFNMNFEQIL